MSLWGWEDLKKARSHWQQKSLPKAWTGHLGKKKSSMPSDFPAGQVYFLNLEWIQIQAEDAWFPLVNHVIPPTSPTMDQLNKKHHSEVFFQHTACSDKNTHACDSAAPERGRRSRSTRKAAAPFLNLLLPQAPMWPAFFRTCASTWKPSLQLLLAGGVIIEMAYLELSSLFLLLPLPSFPTPLYTFWLSISVPSKDCFWFLFSFQLLQLLKTLFSLPSLSRVGRWKWLTLWGEGRKHINKGKTTYVFGWFINNKFTVHSTNSCLVEAYLKQVFFL